MKTNSSSGRVFVEAIFDPENGKTYLRHPENEGEWVEAAIFDGVLKGRPVRCVSGEEACELFATMPHGRKRSEPKKSRLVLTSRGAHGALE